ncbi:DUF6701 domain-containing protein [Thalassotalea agarivorans]|uniref:Concanavalin A-like lectin/glucanases superfamily protein n=1 Tax=Thalassotalea agarivorans TaxID=349064 RepID=A0A1I0G1I2_THASX|nr:DUF6701 domain-containing protein [Thalassotalea agarivorans]SET63717.1 Concanavalin A-like lectin/glucanases superfamily protein [Thalassotalea agarivorans]
MLIRGLAFSLFLFSVNVLAAEQVPPTCDPIFPGPDAILEDGEFTPRSPKPNPPNDGDVFRLRTVQGGQEYVYNEWDDSEDYNLTVSGSGTATIYIKEETVIKENPRLNAGGDPSQLLIIFLKDAKIEEKGVINAYIYAYEDFILEEDNDFSGGLSVEGDLDLKENVDDTYVPPDNIDSGFCQGAPTDDFYYFVETDGDGSTCALETVTIKACTDASCSQLSSETVTLDFVVGGETKVIDLAVTGERTFQFAHLNTGSAAITVANSSKTETSSVECTPGTSCQIDYLSDGCADSCFAYFPDSVQGHQDDSEIEFKDNGLLYDDFDHLVTFPKLKDNDSNLGRTCNTAPCEITGTKAVEMPLGNFKDSTGNTKIDISGGGSDITIGPGGDYTETEYGDFKVKDGATAEFFASGSSYHFKKSEIKNATVTFAEGSYWFEELKIKENAVIITKGKVSIFFKKHSDIESGSKVNVNGNSEDLALIAYDDLHFKENTQTHAFLYMHGDKDITLNNNAMFRGSASARKKLKIEDTAHFFFEGGEPYIEDICGQPVAPTPSNEVAFYSFEETDFSSGIADRTGNGFTGSNNNGVSIPDGRYCRGFSSPNQNRNNNTDYTFNSNVDITNDVGNKGTISFWYASRYNWNRRQDTGGNGGLRTLFDATESSSSGAGDKYFTLKILNNGRLRFNFEDSADRDFVVTEPGGQARQAQTWYYITTTWDFENNLFEIYVDGNRRIQSSQNTNGILAGLGDIVFGDNSSPYATWSNTSSLPARNSAGGRFDEVRIYDKVLTETEIREDMAKSDCATIVDHFEIDHDGSGLTCEAEPILIRACADSSCTALVSDAYDVQLSVNGVPNKTVTVTGGTATTFVNTSPGAATLSLDQNYSCNNLSNGGTDCDVVFADSGFRFGTIDSGNFGGIPTQLSGKPSNTGYKAADLYIQAIQKDPDTGACAGLVAPSATIEVSATCSTPGGACAGQAVQFVPNGIGAGISLPTAPTSYQSTNMLFNAESGTAGSFVMNYPDAGLVTLNARMEIPLDDGTPSGEYIVGSSNPIFVRPLGFYVNAQGNPEAKSASDGKFVTAGEQFPLTIAAVQWQAGDDTDNDGSPDTQNTTVNGVNWFTTANLADNGVTPSFNTSAIQHQMALFMPSGGRNGTFTAPTAYAFSNGVSAQNHVYEEVGIIGGRFSAYQYLGISGENINGYIPHLGRFVPHHFDQSVEKQGNLLGQCGPTTTPGTRDWVYTGQGLEGAVTTGAITYDSELPTYRIEAKSLSGNVTENYIGDFMKLDDSSVTVLSPNNDVYQVGKDGVTLTPLDGVIEQGTIEASTTEKGVVFYTFSVNDSFMYTREANTEIQPYDATIPLAVETIEDDDNVREAATETAMPTGVKIRFGRAVLANSYGPETEDLPQHYWVEYVDDTGAFAPNRPDDCSGFDSTNMSMAKIDLDPSLTDVYPADGMVINAETFDMILEPTGAGNMGRIEVIYDASPWLQYNWETGTTDYSEDPTAVATFGIFRGNDRIIQWQEVNAN